MKKFLLSLMVALIGATMWNTVGARYIQSDRIPYNQIKAGDTIAMEGGTMSGNSDWFMAISEDGKLTNLQGFSPRCAWVVSEGPLNCLGQQTYYLQNVATGEFFAGSKLDPQTNGSGGFTLNKEIEYALPLCIYSAGDSTTVNETYGPIWDENSAVFCFLQDQYADRYEAKYRNFVCNCAYWGSGNVFSWGEYYDTNAWNVYRVLYQHDLQGDLQALIDEISEAGIEYESGTEPGLYPEDKVKAFNDALEFALLTSLEDHTDAEYQLAMDSLRNAKEAVENSVNPIIEGYYYVVSAFPGYLNKQGVEKAWNANSATQVGWATFDYLNPAQIFKFTPLASGNFYIQNYDNEQYVNAPETAGSSHKLLFSAQPGYEQIAKPIGSLQWIFSSTFSNITYHTESHQEGSGTAGDLVTWSDNVINSKNAWYIRLVPDSVMEKIPAIKAQILLDSQLQALATEANSIYDNLVVYKVDTLGLITNATDGDEANQVSSNAKDPSQGSFAALIDGTTDIFHSTWHVDNDPLTKPHNLQFNLSANPTSGFEMVLLQRCDSWGTQDRPTIVNFYATNDPTDEDSWEFIRQIDLSNVWGNNTDNYQNWAKTPIIDLGKEYAHVRMDVLATRNNRKNAGAQYPFFSLAELQMYPVVLDKEQSQYCYTEGLAEKADAMRTLAAAALDKVNTKTTTPEDVEALRAAINAVKGLYADTTDVANLANTLQNYVTTAVFGDGIGQTTPEAAAALQAAINEAKGSSFTTPLVKAEVDAAMNKLTTARDAFMATIKMPEPGKWYFILSASQTETHYNGGDQDDPLPMANSALYADGPGTGDHIRYGLLTEEREPNYTYNPYAMWRLVEIDGSDKYALQCLGTGQYMGNGSAKLQASIYTAQKPVPYAINLLGNASFSLIPEANEYTDYGLVACLKGQHAEVNTPAVYGDGSWKFVEINPEETELIVISSFANNLIDVMAMPYDISYLGDYNDDVHTYGIKKMTKNADNTTTVELYEKEEVKAGESCIIILGNPAEECEANELVIPFPTECVDRAYPVNGIQGMLFSEKSAPGSAYSTGNEFVATADGVGIGANTGAIDASLYKGEVAGVETAYTLTIAGLVWPEAPETTGDVNEDGVINAADVVAIYNYITDGAASGINAKLADVNEDNAVSAADVVAIYAIISGETIKSNSYVEASIIEDGDNTVARLTAAIGNSDDLTAVPVTVFLNNSIDIVAAEYVVVAPVEPAKFVFDEEEDDYMINNTDRWSKGHNAVMIPGTDLHGQDGFFVSITDSKNRAFAGNEGSVATVYFDATGLADGEYEVTIKDGIAITKATDTYKTADMTLKFVVAGGKATGLSTITAEQIAAAKSIVTLDAKPVASPVKGNIYVVDGAVVKY